MLQFHLVANQTETALRQNLQNMLVNTQTKAANTGSSFQMKQTMQNKNIAEYRIRYP
jgi:hypothetical protein